MSSEEKLTPAQKLLRDTERLHKPTRLPTDSYGRLRVTKEVFNAVRKGGEATQVSPQSIREVLDRSRNGRQ